MGSERLKHTALPCLVFTLCQQDRDIQSAAAGLFDFVGFLTVEVSSHFM